MWFPCVEIAAAGNLLGKSVAQCVFSIGKDARPRCASLSRECEADAGRGFGDFGADKFLHGVNIARCVIMDAKSSSVQFVILSDIFDT